MQKKSKFNVFTLMMLIILGLIFQPAISTYAACPDDIFSYWKLDETTTGTYEDFIKDNDGAETVNPPVPVTGIVNEAQDFDGSNMQINVPADNSFDWQFNESFSIEFWVEIDSGAPVANQVIIGRRDGGLQWWVGINGGDGLISFFLRDINGAGAGGPGVGADLPGVESATDPKNPSDGDPHHVVAVRDNSTDENFIYVDGVLQGSSSFNYPLGGGFASATAPLNIGHLTSTFFFDGLIDEVALYDRALPENEIQEHYNAGLAGNDYCAGGLPFVPFPNDTISLWELEETASPYLDSFDGNDGAETVNPPVPVTGIVNEAQDFDGSNMQINVPADNSFDWQFNESFSIEFWVEIDSGAPVANQVIIGRRDGGLQWWVGINGGDGLISFFLRDINGAGAGGPGVGADLPGVESATDPKNPSDGDPHHVVAVRDNSTDENFIYVDGVLQGSSSFNYPLGGGFASATAPLNIGHLTSTFFFDGLIDEVALYDRALPENEIQEHYNAGLAGNGVQSLRPPPVADAGDDQANVVETTEVTLDGIGSVEGYTAAPITTYFWEQTDGTDVGTITDADKITATFDAPDVVAAGETLKFQLTVTASDGQSSSDTVDVGVVENILPDAPDADAGDPQTVTEGDPVTLDGTESTPVGGISYLWVQTDGTQVLPAAGVQAATATFTAPQVDSAGEPLTFKLTVTDNDDQTLTDSDTVTVTVNNNPLAPTADAGDDQDAKEGNTVTLDGSRSSPASGSTITTYLWEQVLPGTPVQLAGASTDTATFTAPDVDETLTFRLTVTDDDNLTSSDTTNVNVSKSSGGGGGGGGGGCFINSMF